MRAYPAAAEEALRARNLLKDWASEGLLTEPQYRRMEQETACDLRRTNVFLRVVFFLFTVIVVGAATGLFFALFLSHPGERTIGVLLLFFAAGSYAAAEFAVSHGRLYRYGIEEALAVCSVAFLCVGLQVAFSTGFLVPAAGAIASLWICHRFGLVYGFPAAMIFAAALPGRWTSSLPAEHAIVVALYAAGLIAVAALRPRYRLTHLDAEYSAIEALLWLGIYLAVNLHLSSVDLLQQWWGRGRITPDFPKTFYWATWILTWCVPPAVLARGLREKDRFVIAAGAIVALLTIATNKPYLGWARHTWDPMLLGALLIGVSLYLRRWLAEGPDGVRHGFTARRVSAKDQALTNAASAGIGLASPHSVTLHAQPDGPHAHFGGGDFGGGGASSDF